MRRLAFIALVSLTVAAAASAAEVKKSTAPARGAAPMDPNNPMVKAMMAGRPGEEHKALAPLIGKFAWNATMRMDATSAPMISSGTAENTAIYAGRFLRQQVVGTAMGHRYAGQGLLGYDNLRKEYQSVWVDNMSTGMMVASGQRDAKSGAIVQSGTMSCPMTNDKTLPFRTEIRVDSPDAHSMVSWQKDKAGKEFKAMEISFTRVK